MHFVEKEDTKLEKLWFWSMTRCELTLKPHPHVAATDYHDTCLLYTSDAADDMQCVDLGGRRIIKKYCGEFVAIDRGE